MKYNPKVNEKVAMELGFGDLHPMQPIETCQGILSLLYETLCLLCKVTGMSWGSLHPFAGAHGEFTGMKLFKAYFRHMNQSERLKVLIPDSAHGTNPASAHIAGFDVVEIPSLEDGTVDLDEVRRHCDEGLAGIMLTNPNTLGIFERHIETIAELIHDAGGLLYYDGANLNAILGKVRPGDMGFDVVHLNLHKTFSGPHGGGGPGSGPVLVNDLLRPYLPEPDIVKRDFGVTLEYGNPNSIGKISGFYGNIAVILRAFTYIHTMGCDGLEAVSEYAVLNANYVKEQIKDYLTVPFDGVCKHEFVATAQELKSRYGVSASDIGKALIDRGIHPPTIYFPLIVKEALMIEPVETETKETLDGFIDAIREIVETAKNNPKSIQASPISSPVGRVDEVRAARHPILTYIAREE